MNRSLRWIIVGVLSMFCVIYKLETRSHNNESATMFIPKDTVVCKNIDTLTSEIVYKMIVDNYIVNPDIVLKQAILETGHFTSRACLEDNNLFGFVSRNGLMKFDSPGECVAWYKQWQKIWYNPFKYKDYYQFLDSIGYATNGTYTSQLKRIRTEWN